MLEYSQAQLTLVLQIVDIYTWLVFLLPRASVTVQTSTQEKFIVNVLPEQSVLHVGQRTIFVIDEVNE